MRMVKSLLAIMMVVALVLPVAALANQPKAFGRGAVGTMPGGNDGGVLHSQLDAPGGDATATQNFEAAFDGYDCFLADDFVVPAGPGWEINEVLLDGQYFNGFGPAVSVNIWIYSNSGANLPNAAVHTRTNQAYVDATGAGDFSITPSPALPCLPPGTYWLVAQVNMDFGVGGQWGWSNRIITTNTAAAWQNPGGAFGIGCTTWSRRLATCGIGTDNAPDQLWELDGRLCQTTPVEAATWGRIKASYPSNP